MSEGATILSFRDARGARAAVKRQSECLVIEVLAFPNSDLSEGNLIAFTFRKGPAMFARWEGPTGRDENGRFVRKGSDRECFLLDIGTRYSRESIKSGAIRILGPVTSGNVVGHVSPGAA